MLRRRVESAILKMAGSWGWALVDIISGFRLSWERRGVGRTSMMGTRALDWPVESN